MDFDNWTPTVSAVTGNATYTAEFTSLINKYTVTWKNDDGLTLETDNNVVYGTMPSYDGSTPTKSATAQYTYTFKGWDTCTKGGVRTNQCQACGHKAEEASLPLGHDFSDGTLVREATIYSTGLYEAICRRCGEGGSTFSVCQYTDEATGVHFETEEGTFEEETAIQVAVLEVKEDPSGDKIQETLKNLGKDFVAYEITAWKDSAVVQPNGVVKVSLPIPEAYTQNIAVYYVSEDGTLDERLGEINMAKRMVTIELEHFSTYVVADLNSKVVEPVEPIIENTGNIYQVMTFVFGGLFLAMTAAFIVTLLKKKGSFNK